MAKQLWTESLYEYYRAMKNAPQLIHRIAFRPRTIEDELVEASLKGSLAKVLSGFELLSIGLGSVIGSGIFILTGQAALLTGSSVIISFLMSGIIITLAAACYAEFAMEYPVAGAGFTYIMLTFGELPAYLTVGNMLMKYVLGTAAVARGFSLYIGRLFNVGIDTLLIGDTSIDFIAFGVVIVSTLVLLIGAKESGLVIAVLNTLHMVSLASIVIAGFVKADGKNMPPFLYGGVDNMFEAGAVIFFAFVGFDVVANAAEEAKKPENIPKALVGTTVVSTFIYFLMSLALVLMFPIPSGTPTTPEQLQLQQTYSAAAFSTAFRAIGMDAMYYITSLSALAGIVTALLVGLFGAARIAMVAARDWLIPPVLATIYPRTQTPVIATVAVGVVAAFVGLFVTYTTLSDLVSICTVLVMWMVANALMFRRYYPGVPRLRYSRWGTVESADAKKLMPVAVPGARLSLSLYIRQWLVIGHLLAVNGISIGLATFYQTHTLCIDEYSAQCSDRFDRWSGSVALIIIWAVITLSMQLLCPLEYQPPKWHIPWWLMPWLPSLSVLSMIFIVASIDNRKIFWIFAAWIVGSLVIYFFFSLPMSYIKHYQLDHVNAEQMNVVELSFRDGTWQTTGASQLHPHVSGLTSAQTSRALDGKACREAATPRKHAVLPPPRIRPASSMDTVNSGMGLPDVSGKGSRGRASSDATVRGGSPGRLGGAPSSTRVAPAQNPTGLEKQQQPQPGQNGQK